MAYHQPVTRAELEAMRGKGVEGVLESLLERGLVRVVGEKEAPGRPKLYGTTERFLEVFGLESLEDLPRSGRTAHPSSSAARASRAGTGRGL